MKKKLIDKFLKMRQDSEDMPLGKGPKGQSGRLGIISEQVSNTKLMVEGLSKTTPTQILQSLFEPFPGFKDVNHIVQKQVAFIEFETDELAGTAMNQRNGYTFTEPGTNEPVVLRVTFAKR